MRKVITIGLLVVTSMVLSACENGVEVADPTDVAAVIASEDTLQSFAPVLAGDHRTADNKARDEYRHPAETLTFFSVAPTATVVEIWPGSGWYTEILAPYLRDEGVYIAAGFDPESNIEFIQQAALRYQAKLDSAPDLYGKTQTAVFMPPNKLNEIADNSVDVVLTFRSVHNWMPRGSQDAIFAAMYRMLKPGGVLGVVEHRADPSLPQDPQASTGYVNQDYAVRMAEKAGFVLNGSSEINANPLDTKVHPEGVWTLPPTLRLKEQDKESYLAIGESDRFTLRFIKPAD
jgi:predicted methyltransferase